MSTILNSQDFKSSSYTLFERGQGGHKVNKGQKLFLQSKDT